MYLVYIAASTLLHLIANAPSAFAQTLSLSCYTVPAWGTKSKPWSTYYDVTTTTGFQTIQAVYTATITGAVPDSTITIHEKIWRTEYHEEYLKTYTSTIWNTRSETLGRPTITITLPASLATPADAPHPSEELRRKKRGEYEEYYMEEYVGEVMLPEPAEKPTKANTVICNAVYHTTFTERKYSVSILNQGQPKRTITLTITHTEVIDQFATQPGTIETTTKSTTYRTLTTTFETVTPQISETPYI